MRKINLYAVLALTGLICLTFSSCGLYKPSAPPAKPDQAVSIPAPPPTREPLVTVYNGLISADMGPIVEALVKSGAHVRVLWHDAQSSDTVCPDYIDGHSMGGNAAIRQANKCQALGKAPKGIVVIDAGRYPLTDSVPPNAKYRCDSFYNNAHPIGGQFIYPDGPVGKLGTCHNTLVPGYDHVYMPSAPGIIKGTVAANPPVPVQ